MQTNLVELTPESSAKEIRDLHSEIEGYLKVSLGKAIRIGELLAGMKEHLPYGQFTPWVENALPFTDRTARNYMNLFHNRDRLKTETVSDLTSAYKLLEAPKKSGEKTAPTEGQDKVWVSFAKDIDKLSQKMKKGEAPGDDIGADAYHKIVSLLADISLLVKKIPTASKPEHQQGEK